MRVLVIDDDASIRTLFEIWLKKMPEDPTVVGVPTLTRAYEEIRSDRPDIVILDLGLPDGNGLDAAKRLLALDPELDIIVITGDAETTTEDAAEQAGVADFLLKNGIHPRTLTRSVRFTAKRRADRRALADSERRHRQVVRSLPGTLVTLYDRSLRLILAEGAYITETGARPEDNLGKHISEMGSPGESPALVEPMERALKGEITSVAYYSSRAKRHVVIEILPYRDDSGRIVGVLSVSRDVTEQRRNDQQRRRAEQRFQVAFERAPSGMAIVSLEGRVEQVNAAFCERVGLPRKEALALEPYSLVHPDDLDELRRRFQSLSPELPAVEAEHRFVHSSGRVLVAHVRFTLVLDEDGEPLHMLAMMQDITERRREHEALREQANHDPLTGLLNRRAFEGAVDDHLAQVHRYGPRGALLLLDLDGFKRVNDTLGHAAGDKVLVTCAAAMQHRVRETDVVGRIGGDEFAILIPEGGTRQAARVAGAIVETLRRDVTDDLVVSASVGLAAIAESSCTREELFKGADAALYQAKCDGKNTFSMAPA